ncbi:MAG TPA: ABC transporter permease, partial [Planctomycetota bacterium]|nr:ABC transporter permease [Planctomycetota bacterium]
IQEAVPRGRMVIGYELHHLLGLDVGDKTTLLGREFTIEKVHPQRGTKDDITAWIHLEEAQELLERKGLINSILALECNCPGDGDERLALIRDEITSILPDTQIIALRSKADARVEARRTAHANAVLQLERERRSRVDLRAEHEEVAAAVVPLALFVSCVWIGLLALGNARSRTVEIGLLRALGVGRRTILVVFLGRSLAVGIAGAIVGIGVGAAGGGALAGLAVNETVGLIHPAVIAGSLLGAPVLAVLATTIPALVAVREDPAVVLRNE